MRRRPPSLQRHHSHDGPRGRSPRRWRSAAGRILFVGTSDDARAARRPRASARGPRWSTWAGAASSPGSIDATCTSAGTPSRSTPWTRRPRPSRRRSSACGPRARARGAGRVDHRLRVEPQRLDRPRRSRAVPDPASPRPGGSPQPGGAEGEERARPVGELPRAAGRRGSPRARRIRRRGRSCASAGGAANPQRDPSGERDAPRAGRRSRALSRGQLAELMKTAQAALHRWA